MQGIIFSPEIYGTYRHNLFILTVVTFNKHDQIKSHVHVLYGNSVFGIT